jgi:molybdopterin adenylyltransferase
VASVTYTAALIVLSDRAASGERPDVCIGLMKDYLGDAYRIVRETVLADDPSALQAELIDLADASTAQLIVTCGGTGLSPRDRTPQATSAVLDYEVPGITEAIRAASIAIVKTAMLSRAVAGVRHRTLIINLPGNPKAIAQSLDVVFSVLPHALELLSGAVVDG